MKVSIIGSGTMGSGIAQIAAMNNCNVNLYDVCNESLENAKNKLHKILNRLSEKNKITKNEKQEALEKICFTNKIEEIKNSNIVIEAIIENINVKQETFAKVEEIIEQDCIQASNTSSLSIASIAGSCKHADRVIGIHFFNPAPLMPLVEIIPSIQTSKETLKKSRSIIDSWGKTTVITKDTPGFIVNRIARPFYGEAIRIYEEGLANFSTIDWAMEEIGGFRMGPFKLMDYIGHDVNYAVTETVFTSFYYDKRYIPSFTQKRMVEAGYLGVKSGKGFYDYSKSTEINIDKDRELGKEILWRILAMLINEAADAVMLNIATKEDIDLAMTKGVNYPKGLLKWGDELGLENILKTLEDLHKKYLEERYRPSPILRKMIKEKTNFY